MMLRQIFKRTKPIRLGRWNYDNSERKTDLANIDHCGTCDLKPLNPIGTHFEKKAIIIKLSACDIRKANKEWRENEYHRIADDIITL
tara:strand:+ start:965 stop:1225 length:261 start_codon:yes stop_codon:yes gene_type:complete